MAGLPPSEAGQVGHGSGVGWGRHEAAALGVGRGLGGQGDEGGAARFTWVGRTLELAHTFCEEEETLLSLLQNVSWSVGPF